jgi:hypothetical protein
MKKDQWMPWVDLYEQYMDSDGVVIRDDILRKVNKGDRTLVALALSVAKWHPEANYRGDGCCALCALTRSNCYKCVLYKKEGKSCVASNYNSLWGKFITAETFADADNAANKMYETLLELYKEEYRRRRN